MKQYFLKRATIAAAAMLSLPALGFAQNDTKADNDGTQQIIIMRKGDKDEKTVIEIKGDKVTVNGKDAAKSDDVTVRLHNLPNGRTFYRTDGNHDFNFDMNHDLNVDLNNDLNERVSLFSEDANRAMLGVTTDEDEKGAKITAITRESAASKAGLKVGDVITKIGDDAIDDADDVARAVREHKPGDKVKISILRDNREQTLTAELGKWKGVRINNLNATIAPVNPMNPATPFRTFGYNFGGPKLGLSVQETEDGNGVKVLQVAEESHAAKAGVKKDDIITHINDEEVESADDVVRTMRDMRKESNVTLKVQRNGKSQTIDVRIPRKLKTADL